VSDVSTDGSFLARQRYGALSDALSEGGVSHKVPKEDIKLVRRRRKHVGGRSELILYAWTARDKRTRTKISLKGAQTEETTARDLDVSD